MAIADVDPLQLGQILGSLLSALIDAERHAAQTSIEFVGDVGLARDEAGVERLRTVTFTYRKKDENGQPADFEAEIPLLAMVSVPTLAVRKASIAFSYDIVVAQAVSEEGNEQPLTGAVKPAFIQGYVRRTARGTSESRTSIDVNVTVERGQLPVGIERALDVAELGIGDRKPGAPR